MEIARQVRILPHMRQKEGWAWGGDGKTPPRGMGGVNRACWGPVVSRKKRGFSAHSGPGGVVQPPRVLSLKKINVLDAVGYIPQAAGKAVGGMGRA